MDSSRAQSINATLKWARAYINARNLDITKSILENCEKYVFLTKYM